MAALTTSGTYSYSPSVINIMTAALRIAQIIGDDETPTGAEYQNTFDAFSLLVQSLQATNSHVWLQEDVTLFLNPFQSAYSLGIESGANFAPTLTIAETTLASPATSGSGSISVASATGFVVGYTIGIQTVLGSFFWTTIASVSGTTVGITDNLPANAAAASVVVAYPTSAPRPLKVSGARLYTFVGHSEVPLVPMSRLDYYNVKGRVSSSGMPQQWFFDPQTGFNSYSNLQAIMQVYPAPADDTIALRFTAQRPIQDLGSLASRIDFPAEWNALLKWLLAYEIGPQYGCPTEQLTIIKDQITAKLPVMAAWDKETQGTTTFPFTSSVYQIISRALRQCGAVGPQDVPSYGLVMNAFMALQAMISQWQASSIHVWCEEEIILFPQPAQTFYFIGPNTTDHATTWNDFTQTNLATNAATSDGSINVASAVGLAVGDQIGIQLDSGTNFWTTIESLSGTVVGLTDPMPGPATSPAAVFDYTTPLIRPLRMYSYRRYSVQLNVASRYDVPMTIWARLDYQSQPNKTTPGVMTAAFYDPQIGTPSAPYGSPETSQLNIWPAPDNYNYLFRGTSQRPLKNITDLTSNIDFPIEWQNALTFNLAVDLWPEYGNKYYASTSAEADPQERPITLPILTEIARQKLQSAMSWDTEPESILFGVAMQPGYRTR